MTIGERIRKLRTTYGYSIQEIAEFLELTHDEVTMLEEDTMKLTLSKLERLCELYNVEDDYIVYGITSKDNVTEYDSQNLDLETMYKLNKIVRNITFLTNLSDKQ